MSIVVVMYLWFSRSKPEGKPLQEKVSNVRVVIAEPGEHAPRVTLYGQLEARSDTTLTAAINADVLDVPVLPGQQVAAGDTLVMLDRREAQLTLEQAKADRDLVIAQGKTDRIALNNERELLEIAEKDLRRFTDLKVKGLASQAQLDAARQNRQRQELAVAQRELAVAQFAARKAQAVARLERAQLDFERANVTAPFAGSVTAVEVSPGDRVNPGQPLIAMFDPSSIEIRATIPNQKLAAARAGLADGLNAVVIDAEQRYPAKLLRIAANRMPGSGGTNGYFRLLDDSVQLQPGRSVTVELQLPSLKNAVVVPFAAVYGLDRVYRVVDDRLQPVIIERLGSAVTPAGESGSWLLVRAESLTAGTQIAATQLPNATAGLKVRIANPLSDPMTDATAEAAE